MNPNNIVTSDTFTRVLTLELKRAVRSQTFLTLFVMGWHGDRPVQAAQEMAAILSRELRETDLITVNGTKVAGVVLDTARDSFGAVIGRVRTCLEDYYFAAPARIEIGWASCPSDGADLETLSRLANAARTPLTTARTRQTAHSR